ncbi:polyprenyl synthetase family protein [Facklamia sp. 7083-14-GEN3]|uniref:polyprenyl synthetase family protein n=1 Tax=Facklamia sp. 7083-14-GEN3 TaxID=2973478 RepID=UPI00215B9BF4|nr:farnesyl diphosphate synthase [Facklamia sp. 7083-14-GEN3]MCR8969322.1 polyprenyl synthetase family protein [Facklamia sp. 7083-14-GEN3]
MILGGPLRSKFEHALQEQVLSLKSPLEMVKPMVYSLNSGGKRLRPLLLLSTIEVLNPKKVDQAISTAIALEFIHTYSLIHDDLPAMDNDELRRGQPTSHIKFDEATAILAGDALQADAFAILSKDESLQAHQKIALIRELAHATGSSGMVAGQLYDIKAENKTIDIEQLQQIHLMKTGLLFIFAMKAASIILETDQDEKELMITFGQHYGVAYQIHNDLKDVIDLKEEVDGLTYSDIINHKSTYPSLLGVEQAKVSLVEEIQLARKVLKDLEKVSHKSFQQLDNFLTPLEKYL